ncbi:uncharacterized protein LOC136030813 [Artemia franciscana]|uniref:Uncharacterized protein n=1 Tax=Artemia franciscana TaxID=6661 RepID=A0AA88HGB3_ARTSF|nr:hypothetical protein QYM36_016950 [Artemia franciscana]
MHFANFVKLLILVWAILPALTSAESVIGLNIGTVYSSVSSVVEDTTVRKIETIPSYVGISNEGLIVGHAAKEKAISDPKNVAFGLKRLLGLNWEQVKKHAEDYPFDLDEDNGRVVVRFERGNKTFTLVELVSAIIRDLKNTSSHFLDEDIQKAVIAVPAFFTQAQRHAMIEAANLAGLDVLRLISEASAATLAYRINGTDDSLIMVVDLGGGTLDISLVYIKDKTLSTIINGGHNHLGGLDFDNNVMRYYKKKYKEKGVIQHKLRSQVILAKEKLSKADKYELQIECENETIPEILTRTDFDRMNIDLYEKIEQSITETFHHAGFERTIIDEVLLTGGALHTAMIKKLLSSYFGITTQLRVLDGSATTSNGAALLGAALSGNPNLMDYKIQASIAHDIGVETNQKNMHVYHSAGLPLPQNNISVWLNNNEILTVDGQKVINIYEGRNKKKADDNLLVNKIILKEPNCTDTRTKLTIFVDESNIIESSAETFCIKRMTKENIRQLAEEKRAVHRANLERKGTNTPGKTENKFTISFPAQKNYFINTIQVDNEAKTT